MLNRVVLIGRLTKDVELRYSQSGVAIANFTLAVERNYKNAQGEKETDFIPIVAYRQLAEICANYLAKGKLAAVDGRIQVRSYTGQDGQKRYITEIIAEEMRLLSPREHTEASNGGAERPYSAASQYGHEVPADDVPF
jgi:single-strand DNA-binding protein